MLLPYYMEDGIEAACDEAGRGPLAGPVYAAAVIWPKDLVLPDIDDSKKLPEQKRYLLRRYIEENALDFAVASVGEEEIDRINILRASIKAMHLALQALKHPFDRIIVDGNKFYAYENIPHHTIVKGDGKYLGIAAASILAKTYRDDYMMAIHEEYPYYNWKNNKGYPTAEHISQVLRYGTCKYHRQSFCRKLFIRHGKLF